jgi:DNA-binding beta-propeller fold protein YncE
MIRTLGPWIAALAIAAAATAHGETAAPVGAGSAVPSALVWGADGRIRVALRDARRVVTVDPETRTIEASWPLPFSPFSLAFAEEGSTLLVGGTNGELVVLGPEGRLLRTLPAGRGLTRVVALPEGKAAVASLWDGAVRIVDARGGEVVSVHRFPFATGAMVRRPDGRVVVADAFGGQLGDLVPGRRGTERVRAFEGVNLHALAVARDGREVLIAHMEQEEPAPVSAANIDRGLILSSRLSAVRFADFDSPADPDAPLPRRQVTLDGPVHGAADPSALAVSPDGTQVLIALAGAHQLIRSDRTAGAPSSEAPDVLPLGHNQRLEVVEVGRTPVGLALDAQGRRAATADAMSDTLTIVRVVDLARVATIRLAPPGPGPTSVQRGEAHFRDGRRALDRWMSCASCHAGGHTAGLNFDTRGDGGDGAPKNTPSLLGVGGTEPLAWVGLFPRLADQVDQSFLSSLRGPAPSKAAVADVTAYLESLAPPPPRRPGDDPAAIRGARVFHARRCDACHRPPLYTASVLRDVGLDDGPAGHRRFNPPSLRGVAWSAPYFHDGRAGTLAEVLAAHSPGQPRPLSPSERDDLVAFLESL